MTVRGADKLIRQLQRLPVDARAGIGTALASSVIILDAYAKQKIQGGGRSGRVYTTEFWTDSSGRLRRGKPRPPHQASAPGEYPKTDTGQLVSSLFFRVAADKLSAFFGTKLAYGRYLEFGTSRMKARPWLRPTLKASAEVISKKVRDAVNEAMRKTARG